mmetsp:Transcript_15710/g.29773  ORF Transcript_15710/g.29773 Transcript_15710/m.29773 type:complete len:96 (-) Transcript_15710:1502-1789(-)
MPRSSNTALAAIFALFAYLPFELVAKGTLVLCASIFILDPFPLSRIVAIIAVVVVGFLAKLEKKMKKEDHVAPVADEKSETASAVRRPTSTRKEE